MTTDSPGAGEPKKPAWIRVRAACGGAAARLRRLVDQQGLHTVCTEALCPNLGRCWEQGRATLMILGDRCTRGCAFCGVQGGGPGGQLDEDEPRRAAEAVASMGLREVVITSVTRDDLPDAGAGLWAETIGAVRERCPGVLIEVLVPDFSGRADLANLVLAAGPDVWGHNLETVRSQTPAVRAGADYDRSLAVLARGAAAGVVTKTSLMLGLGEDDDEVAEAMRDARAAGCDIVYLGQYLRPSWRQRPVARYVEPAAFDRLRERGLALGIPVVVAAPLVRSSYHSEEQRRYLEQRGLYERGAVAVGAERGGGAG